MMETAERMVCLPQVSASVQEAVQLFHSVGCALIIHEGHEAIGQSLAYTLLSQRRKRLYYCITPTPPNDRSSDPIEGGGGVLTGGDIPLDLHVRDLAVLPEQSFKVLLGTKFGQITCIKIV